MRKVIMNQKKKEQGIVVPHRQLSAGALQGLLEEFVTRDGTDTGYTKLTLDERVAQVRRQLDRGEVVIVYDAGTQTANIVPREDATG